MNIAQIKIISTGLQIAKNLTEYEYLMTNHEKRTNEWLESRADVIQVNSTQTTVTAFAITTIIAYEIDKD